MKSVIISVKSVIIIRNVPEHTYLTLLGANVVYQNLTESEQGEPSVHASKDAGDTGA